jgi:hypothetical protein
MTGGKYFLVDLLASGPQSRDRHYMASVIVGPRTAKEEVHKIYMLQ